MSDDAPPSDAEIYAAILALYEVRNLGDFVYDVRARAGEDPNFKGDSWEHPNVVKWSRACTVLARFCAAHRKEQAHE